MILHIGSDIVVKDSELIGIFDIENTSVSKYTRAYFRNKQKNGSIVDITGEIPKSFLVTVKDGKERVYLSQLAPATLKKRSLK